jgi:hypothetical protein
MLTLGRKRGEKIILSDARGGERLAEIKHNGSYDDRKTIAIVIYTPFETSFRTLRLNESIQITLGAGRFATIFFRSAPIQTPYDPISIEAPQDIRIDRAELPQKGAA